MIKKIYIKEHFTLPSSDLAPSPAGFPAHCHDPAKSWGSVIIGKSYTTHIILSKQSKVSSGSLILYGGRGAHILNDNNNGPISYHNLIFVNVMVNFGQ